MPHVLSYHRPTSLANALTLLRRAHPPTRLLAGGTLVNADPAAAPVDVVDLQALGLAGITIDGTTAAIGAMTTLQDIVDDTRLPDVLRELARRELPSALRTLATVGGTIAAGSWESELLAGLLVMECTVVTTAGEQPLNELLANGVAPATIITSIRVHTNGDMSVARTGRTPADTPIVAVVARRTANASTVAATGVATTPILVDPAHVGAIKPPTDFRGSGEYRNHLLRVLINRVSS